MDSSPPLNRRTIRLDVPSDSSSRPRAQRSPSQRFALPNLLSGSNSRNDSRSNLPFDQVNSEPYQRLPQAPPPSSLSGPAVRASLAQSNQVNDSGSRFRSPNDSQPLSRYTSAGRSNAGRDDPEALWSEMQRTLAEVDISALNTSSSSNVFGAAHSRALEDLRTAQLSLAQAWARSEADEMGGGDSKEGTDNDDDFTMGENVGKAMGLTSSPSKHRRNGSNSHDSKKGRRRTSSVTSASAIARDLEAETERDIQLARKRREANDRYFQQVNKGVLDVVAELDKVAEAMRSMERESRETWDEREPASSSDTGSGARPITRRENKPGRKNNRPAIESESEEESDDNTHDAPSLKRTLTKNSEILSDTDGLSASPVTPRLSTKGG